MFLSIGSIIIDDIVLPDGQTCMGALGGGMTHAAMGMRVWSERVGVLAAVGDDFPEAARREMALAFDVRGLIRRDVPTPRAWQVCETDGRRTDVFRTDPAQYDLISVRPENSRRSTRVQPAPIWHVKRPNPSANGWRGCGPEVVLASCGSRGSSFAGRRTEACSAS